MDAGDVLCPAAHPRHRRRTAGDRRGLVAIGDTADRRRVGHRGDLRPARLLPLPLVRVPGEETRQTGGLLPARGTRPPPASPPTPARRQLPLAGCAAAESGTRCGAESGAASPQLGAGFAVRTSCGASRRIARPGLRRSERSGARPRTVPSSPPRPNGHAAQARTASPLSEAEMVGQRSAPGPPEAGGITPRGGCGRQNGAPGPAA